MNRKIYLLDMNQLAITAFTGNLSSENAGVTKITH